MTTLYEIIGVATDVIEMSVNHLIAQPKICEQFVQRIQNIGRAWDDHPDWHGRNWYVQVLLSIASLSRVVEWWEAERQFWNFDEKKEEEQEEPLIFVMKPAYESTSGKEAESSATESGDPYKLSADEDSKMKMTRPPSLGKRSRGEATKEPTIPSTVTTPQRPSLADKEDSSRTPSKFVDTTESARVLATERLRLQAEKAQNQNVVMELSLDGDYILWINYAWENVVGCVSSRSIIWRHLHSPNVSPLSPLFLLFHHRNFSNHPCGYVERIPRNYREPGYLICCLPPTGMFSVTPHSGCRKTILTPSRFGSSSRWSQTMIGTTQSYVLWRAKAC